MKHALSSLLMSPLTSPDDHIPVKPASSIEFNEIIEDSDTILTTLKVLTVILLC